MSRRTHNRDLPPLPSTEEILAALVEAEQERRYEFGISANRLAYRLGVQGARRLGRGAVKGSWSGYMSASLRLSPKLASLCRAGLVERYRTPGEYRWTYAITLAGRVALKNPQIAETSEGPG